MGQFGVGPRDDREPPLPVLRRLPSLESSENWRWHDGFSLPLLDDRVHALTTFRGELVAAGEFQLAGGQVLNGIACWRGGRWQPLGDGFGGDVSALAVYGDLLIAGGSYSSRLGPVASWDGRRWTPLGVPLSGWGEVRALLVDGASLIVAGLFDRMGERTGSGDATEVPVSNIARWDGQGWSPIGPGVDGPVDALGRFQGQLVAAGEFSKSGDSPVSRVARWDGGAWQAIGTGITGTLYSRIGAVAEFANELYVARFYDEQPPLLRFTGASWDTVPGIEIGNIAALRAEPDGLVVVGWFGSFEQGYNCVAEWTGAGWSPIGETPWPMAFAVTRFNGHLIAGGFLADGTWSPAQSNVMSWDGVGWSALETVSDDVHGLLGTVEALGLDHEDIVAAGRFHFPTASGWSATQLVARWDGGAWHAMTDSLNGHAMCLATYRGDLMVGGNIFTPDRRVQGVARWTGGAWDGGFGLTGSEAYDFAVSGDTLYAAGWFRLDGQYCTIARFDGTRWESLSPDQPGIVRLAIHHGELFAGGRFDSIGGISAHNIARWDGARWNALGEGTSNYVLALASTDSCLVVGGEFSRAGAVQAHGLALWDERGWRPFPGVFADVTRAVYVTGGQLYVSANQLLGQPDPAIPAGIDLGNIARWDGVEWHALGDGLNRLAATLLRHEDDLVVGGDFSEAGHRSSFGIAEWQITPHPAPPTRRAVWLAVGPNPMTRAGARLSFSLVERADVHVTIQDISGRKIATLLAAVLSPGTHDLRWAGTDDRGRRVPPGIYFAVLSTSRSSAGTRLVMLE